MPPLWKRRPVIASAPAAPPTPAPTPAPVVLQSIALSPTSYALTVGQADVPLFVTTGTFSDGTTTTARTLGAADGLVVEVGNPAAATVVNGYVHAVAVGQCVLTARVARAGLADLTATAQVGVVAATPAPAPTPGTSMQPAGTVTSMLDALRITSVRTEPVPAATPYIFGGAWTTIFAGRTFVGSKRIHRIYVRDGAGNILYPDAVTLTAVRNDTGVVITLQTSEPEDGLILATGRLDVTGATAGVSSITVAATRKSDGAALGSVTFAAIVEPADPLAQLPLVLDELHVVPPSANAPRVPISTLAQLQAIGGGAYAQGTVFALADGLYNDVAAAPVLSFNPTFTGGTTSTTGRGWNYLARASSLSQSFDVWNTRLAAAEVAALPTIREDAHSQPALRIGANVPNVILHEVRLQSINPHAVFPTYYVVDVGPLPNNGSIRNVPYARRVCFNRCGVDGRAYPIAGMRAVQAQVAVNADNTTTWTLGAGGYTPPAGAWVQFRRAGKDSFGLNALAAYATDSTFGQNGSRGYWQLTAVTQNADGTATITVAAQAGIDHNGGRAPDWLVGTTAEFHEGNPPDIRRGIGFRGTFHRVLNTRSDNIMSCRQDTQAVAVFRGPGPHTTFRCALTGAITEPTVVGGFNDQEPLETPQDIYVGETLIHRRGIPAHDYGGIFFIKNLDESKIGLRKLYERTVGDWSPQGSMNQSGSAVVLKTQPYTDDNNFPQSPEHTSTRDVVVRDNLWRRIVTIAELTGAQNNGALAPTYGSQRLAFRNNLSIAPLPVQRNFSPAFAKLNSAVATSTSRLVGLVLDHNTHLGGGILADRVGAVNNGGIYLGDWDAGTPSRVFESTQITRNVMTAGPMAYGVRLFGGGSSNYADENLSAVDCFPGGVIDGNAVMNWDGHALAAFPNNKPVGRAAFAGAPTTSLAALDYAVRADATANDGTLLSTLGGGQAPGADVMRVLALTAGVDEPGLIDGY